MLNIVVNNFLYNLVKKVKKEAVNVTLMEWSALLFCMIGVWYITVDVKVLGLYVMFLAQICWLVHAYRTRQLILGVQARRARAQSLAEGWSRPWMVTSGSTWSALAQP